MSKTITVYLVDRSLGQYELGLVNDFLENALINRLYWARKTHQIGIFTGNGQAEAQELVPFGPVSKEMWELWRKIEPSTQSSTAYDDIMSAGELIKAYIKKLKFTQRILWFGPELPQFNDIKLQLARNDIEFIAIIPDGDDEVEDLESYCTVPEVKEVGATKMYEGPLSLGYLGSADKIALHVKCFPFNRYTAPPTTNAVDSAGNTISQGRDKFVDEKEVDPAELQKGFSYGSEIILFSQELAETAKYTNLEQAFEIIGFVDPVPELYVGESNIVQANDDDTQHKMADIVRSLYYQQKVILARFVKGGKNPSLQLVLLEPYIQPDEHDKLLMTPVALAHDTKQFKFADLEKIKDQDVPGDELVAEMDRIVDEMDLEAQDYQLSDLIVPNPKTQRLMAYMRDAFTGKEIEIKEPRLPTSLVESTENLKRKLNLTEIAKNKIVKEEEDLIADEQELDLDELL